MTKISSIVLGGLFMAMACGVAVAQAPPNVRIVYDPCGVRSIAWDPVAGATNYRLGRCDWGYCCAVFNTFAETAGLAVLDLPIAAQRYEVTALANGIVLGSAQLDGDGADTSSLSVTSEWADLQRCVGDTLQLRVTVRSRTDVVSFQWRRNGVPVATTTSPNLEVPISGDDDGAAYSVIVTNACESASSTWEPVQVGGFPPAGVLSWTYFNHSVARFQYTQGEPLGGGMCHVCAPIIFRDLSSSHDCSLGELTTAGFLINIRSQLLDGILGGFPCPAGESLARTEAWSASAQVLGASHLFLSGVATQQGTSAPPSATLTVRNNGVLIWNLAGALGAFAVTLEVLPGSLQIDASTPLANYVSFGINATGAVIPDFPDCNENGVPDALDISERHSADSDANGVPDECQVRHVPGDFATIQAAIDAAPANEMRIIAVAPGTYPGPINFLGKPVVVRGAGAGQTIIQGSGGQQLSVVRFSGGEPATAALEHVTVRDGATGTPAVDFPSVLVGGGLYAYQSAASVRDCVFENNSAGFGGGAYFRLSTGEISNCVFRNNSAASDGGGIQISSGGLVVTDTLVELNQCNSRGGGMHLVQGDQTLVRVAIQSNYSYNLIGGLSWYSLGSSTAQLGMLDCSVTGNGALLAQGGIGVTESIALPPALSLTGATVCNNAPRPNVSGRWTDLGGNAICDCAGDLTLDGTVNGADLGILLGQWGPATPATVADINHDGHVDGADLGMLLGAWGPCPK